MKFGTMTHIGPYSGSTVKILNFWEFKMAAAAVLKITKIAISLGILTAPIVKTFEFHEFKMADGRHFKNRYIAISLQPFDWFWWNLAWWRILAPYSGMVVKISIFLKKFKMAAAAMLKITKIAIYPQRFDRSLPNLVRWCKIGLLTAPTVEKIRISQIQDGGRPPF